MTDGKTDPPTSDPAIAMVLERLSGIENAIKATQVLLDAKTDAIIDLSNQRFATIEVKLNDVADAQEKQGRILKWLRKAVGDFVDDWETFKVEYTLFQDHVFDQFKRTPSLRVVGSDAESNGNGHSNGNGNGHDPHE